MLKNANSYIQIKVPTDEKSKLEDKAKSKGMSLSAYVGMLLYAALSFEAGLSLGESFADSLINRFNGGSDGKKK